AIGGLAWALIYATVGLVAFMAWFELFLVSPWGAVAVLALVVVLIAMLLRHKRRTGGRSAAQVGPQAAAEAAETAQHARSWPARVARGPPPEAGGSARGGPLVGSVDRSPVPAVPPRVLGDRPPQHAAVH